MLEAVQRTFCIPEDPREFAQLFFLDLKILLRGCDFKAIVDVVQIVLLPDGNGQRNENSGNGAVNAGFEHEIPAGHSQDRENGPAGSATFAVEEADGHKHKGQEEIGEMKVFAVKNRDHENGTEVIDNGQTGEKDLQGGGHAGAEQAEHAEGKGNIRGHGHAPGSTGFG